MILGWKAQKDMHSNCTVISKSIERSRSENSKDKDRLIKELRKVYAQVELDLIQKNKNMAGKSGGEEGAALPR